MSFLDKLSKFLPSKSQESAEYFFGLNVEPNLVTGSVWGIERNRIKIVRTAEAEYSGETDLIQQANIALDEALADFQPEPTKILFGVPDKWLQDEDLKPEYAQTLKQMVKELDVVPMAYVSTTHAICHLMQKQQGVPATAVLVDITEPLIVTVVKAGKVIGSKEQKRTANLPQDIEKALLSFTDVEVLPSKILIYGKERLEKFKEELVSFNWMAQLPFLHLPKIEELEENVCIKAISFAGASEIDPGLHFHPKDLEIESLGAAAGISRSPLLHSNLASPVKDEIEDLGFVAGDIERTNRPAREETALAQEDETLDNAVDIYDRPAAPAHHGHPGEVAHHGGVPGGSALEKLKNAIITPLTRGGLGVLIIPLVVLVILAAVFLFVPKAQITVFVDPRVLEKDAQVIADPAVTAVDEANKKIPGKIVETTVDGSGKGSATGKKQIGDPAKGSVIIYNKTSAPKSFSAGTVLVGPGNLEFKLDSAVNVASQSAVEGGISFGKGTVNVTAAAIGPDGNLAAGKDLSIKGQSGDYSAKVDQALSGGISKDVTVVTADDQAKLLAQVSSDLRKQAQEQLQGKLTGDLKVLEEALSESVVKKSFSKNVGDQASEFTLNLTTNLKGTAYSDNDLKSIVSKLVETNVPEGFDLDLSRTETQATVSKVEKDGKLVFAAKFKAKLMPKFDMNKIKSEIAFKTFPEVESRLKSIENVIGADIKVTPSLPGPLQRLPMMTKNINIEITSK